MQEARGTVAIPRACLHHGLCFEKHRLCPLLAGVKNLGQDFSFSIPAQHNNYSILYQLPFLCGMAFLTLVDQHGLEIRIIDKLLGFSFYASLQDSFLLKPIFFFLVPLSHCYL